MTRAPSAVFSSGRPAIWPVDEALACWHALVDLAPVALLTLTAQGHIVQFNQRAAVLLGLRGPQTEPLQFDDFVVPEERLRWETYRNQALVQQETAPTLWSLRAGGGMCRVQLYGRPWPVGPMGCGQTAAAPEMMLTIALIDVSISPHAAPMQTLLASVFTHARQGILITTPEGRILDVNEAFTRITGYAHDEAVDQTPRILNSGRHGKDFYTAMWKDVAEQGYWQGEIWNRRKNGEIYAEMLTITAVHDDNGALQNYMALFSDITTMKEQQHRLEQSAYYDALTGLPNRLLLMDRLQQACTLAQRHGGALAVAYIDLDGFKAVNDRYGHEVGDGLLTLVAGRMKQVLRESDTLARWGGDEFVAVLTEAGDLHTNPSIFDRLLVAAAQPVLLGGLTLTVSASIGVTTAGQGKGVDAQVLLRQADEAMYQAKMAGKNCYRMGVVGRGQ